MGDTVQMTRSGDYLNLDLILRFDFIHILSIGFTF